MKLSKPSRVLISLVMLILCWVAFDFAIHAQVPESSSSPQAQPSPQSVTQLDEPVSETLMEKTASGLRWFFTVVVYPAIVCTIFLLLIGSIIHIIGKGKGYGSVRRLTGALLPLLLLTFMLLVTDKGEDPIRSFFLNRSLLVYLVAGILIGIALVELGKRLVKTDDDRMGSIYNVFLSLMVVFLLYSIMKGFLDSLIYFLFSMTMAGGLDIVFGAPMEPQKTVVVVPSEPQTERPRPKRPSRPDSDDSSVHRVPESYPMPERFRNMEDEMNRNRAVRSSDKEKP